jgi:hypothetical protein
MPVRRRGEGEEAAAKACFRERRARASERARARAHCWLGARRARRGPRRSGRRGTPTAGGAHPSSRRASPQGLMAVTVECAWRRAPRRARKSFVSGLSEEHWFRGLAHKDCPPETRCLPASPITREPALHKRDGGVYRSGDVLVSLSVRKNRPVPNSFSHFVAPLIPDPTHPHLLAVPVAHHGHPHRCVGGGPYGCRSRPRHNVGGRRVQALTLRAPSLSLPPFSPPRLARPRHAPPCGCGCDLVSPCRVSGSPGPRFSLLGMPFARVTRKFSFRLCSTSTMRALSRPPALVPLPLAAPRTTRACA